MSVLPFFAFGLASMLTKFPLSSFHDVYLRMVVYLLILTGLLIGWVRDFPLWSYTYLDGHWFFCGGMQTYMIADWKFGDGRHPTRFGSGISGYRQAL